MRKFILWGIVLLIILCSGYISKLAFEQPTKDIIKIGTFLVLSLTLIILIIYTYDTNRLASIGQLKWERENILNASFEMLGIEDKGKADRIIFRINNPSTLIIRAKIWCEIKVYGTPVIINDDFNGTNIWLVFPQQTSQGWYEIKPLLEQQGKTPQQMIQEYSPGNRRNQLTLDLTIEFRDELGNRRKLPTKKHYFAFNEWRWIPVLTGSNVWEQ